MTSPNYDLINFNDTASMFADTPTRVTVRVVTLDALKRALNQVALSQRIHLNKNRMSYSNAAWSNDNDAIVAQKKRMLQG